MPPSYEVNMNRLNIINKAFLKLSGSPVANLSDQDNRVVSILAIYDSVRNTEQTSYRWTFCTKRFLLEKVTEEVEGETVDVVPAFEYKYTYNLPLKFLRLIHIYGHDQVDYVIEGTKLLTNYDGPLKIIALCVEEEEEKFPPAFVEVFAIKLAIELCPRIQQDTSIKAELWKEYFQALSIAKKTDAIQRAVEYVPDGEWVNIRRREIMQ